MTIFERIKELADKQGKSLQRVSEDLGLSQNYIYNLKGAKSPAADKLSLIADYFQVSVDYLLGRIDVPTYYDFAEKWGLVSMSSEGEERPKIIMDLIDESHGNIAIFRESLLVLAKNLKEEAIENLDKRKKLLENGDEVDDYKFGEDPIKKHFLLGLQLESIIKEVSIALKLEDNLKIFDYQITLLENQLLRMKNRKRK